MSAEQTPSHEQRVDAVLAEYLEAEAAGQTPDRHAILARHPDLADALRSFFADHDRLNGLAPQPWRPWWEDHAPLAHALARRGLANPEAAPEADRCLGLAEAAVRVEPGNAAYLGTLGAALLHVGRVREAVDRLAEAVRRHPEGGEVWSLTYLALARHRLKQPGETKRLLEQAKLRLAREDADGEMRVLWYRVRALCRDD
jgi:predicted Zn-dependent protease